MSHPLVEIVLGHAGNPPERRKQVKLSMLWSRQSHKIPKTMLNTVRGAPTLK